MLFNSHIFIFLFLPLTLIVYFTLNRMRLVTAARVWLVMASLFFYAYWNTSYLLLIITSVVVNYATGVVLARPGAEVTGPDKRPRARGALVAGIIFNLGLLSYFKYADFFIANINAAFGASLPLLHIVLPLAISFFTFQQIAYLVDRYKGLARQQDFLNYCLFVTFFPQLIAGPIVHHREMMPQFASLKHKILNHKNIAEGISLFTVGLFKKIVIADTLAVWAAAGYDSAETLNFLEAWTTSLSFTLQIYYDFCGYTDMALGAALLFNIRLPLNFNTPYRSLSVREFWRRWHMTLSRWLRDYVYIPLGGNRLGNGRTYVNLFTTFLLGGLWHGAGWTFVIWGAMHGAASCLQKAWEGSGLRLPGPLAWISTLFFLNLTWVFFRAESLRDALKVIKGIFGFSGFAFTLENLGDPGGGIILMEFASIFLGIEKQSVLFAFIFVFGMLAVIGPNSVELKERFRPGVWLLIILSILFALSVLSLGQASEFIYFNF